MYIQKKSYSMWLALFITLPLLMEFKVISESAGRPALIISFIQVIIFTCSLKKIRISLESFIDIKKLSYLILLLVLSTIILFSSNFAISISASLKSSILFLLPSSMLVLLAFSDEDKVRTIEMILKILVVFGFLISIYGIVIYFFGQYDHNTQYLQIGDFKFTQIVMGEHKNRISSVTSNPNVLGTLLIFTIPANFYFIKILKKSKILISILIIQMFTLLLTQSRASIISVIVILLVYTFFMSEKKFKFIFVGLSLFLLLLAAIFLSEIFPIERLSDGLNGRDEQWIPLINSIKENPFTGVGFGLANRVIIQRETHNVYLSVLAEMGIVGLVSFLGFWLFGTLNIFLKARSNAINFKEYKILIFVLSISLGLFIHQFFETDLMQFDFTTLFWVFILTIGCNNYNIVQNAPKNSIDYRSNRLSRSKI